MNDIENNMLLRHSQKLFTLQIFQEICFCFVLEKTFTEMVHYQFLTPKN